MLSAQVAASLRKEEHRR
ncbi:hypothetical protein [Lysobacter enzymogenes]